MMTPFHDLFVSVTGPFRVRDEACDGPLQDQGRHGRRTGSERAPGEPRQYRDQEEYIDHLLAVAPPLSAEQQAVLHSPIWPHTIDEDATGNSSCKRLYSCQNTTLTNGHLRFAYDIYMKAVASFPQSIVDKVRSNVSLSPTLQPAQCLY